jgi:hypothetical protein
LVLSKETRVMTYRGHVKNGQITLDDPIELPEGAAVNVDLVAVETAENGQEQPTIWEKLLKLAGTVEGPEDWARNHDHYIHGTPKRP